MTKTFLVNVHNIYIYILEKSFYSFSQGYKNLCHKSSLFWLEKTSIAMTVKKKIVHFTKYFIGVFFLNQMNFILHPLTIGKSFSRKQHYNL